MVLGKIKVCADHYVRFFACIWPELAVMVKDMLYVEWLLYVEPDYEKYRDHLLHMFKVACLGTWMLSNNNFLQQVVDLQFGNPNTNSQAPEHFRQWMHERKIDPQLIQSQQKTKIIEWAFLFAALFHDIGYGYFLPNFV